MNLIKAITFLLCSTLLVGQTVPLRNPQIQGASGAIISGATLTNSGTFVNSGTINGAGTFNLGSGTVTLPASSVTSGNITDGAIINADINASAAIDISKLASSAITIAGTSTLLGGSITASAILDSISSTQGTILYRGASGWAALSPGTSGHFLKTQGAGANPMWDAAAGSGSVATDAIWDAAGDLAVGTGANTAARLAIGTSGHVLTSNGTTAAWAAPTGGAFSTLSDVDLTSITSGDMLKWNGTDWINRTAANVRTDLGLVIGTNVQAYDADLTTYAGITPSANMQSLLGAADYSAMRTQLGLGAAALLGTSIGGNGTGDSGKVVIFNANGGISLGKNDQTNTPLTIAISSGYGTVVTVEDFIGFGHYVELKGSDSVGFHAHVPGSSTGNHQGFTADMSGGTGINYGYQATVPSNGLVFLGSEYVNPLTSPRIAITATGDIHRYLNGTTFTSGTDKTILTFASPSGTKTITFPATTGTAVITSSGSVALTTDTTGNYVADVAGTANEITSTHTPGEGSTATLSLPATIDLGGKTSFELPNGAAPTVDAFGELAGDNNLWAASRGAPIFYDGTAATALVNVLVSDTPTNGQVPTWNTGGTITWETGGGLSAPTLAGINSITSATGQALTLATLDSNADIIFDPHGTGKVNVVGKLTFDAGTQYIGDYGVGIGILTSGGTPQFATNYGGATCVNVLGVGFATGLYISEAAAGVAQIGTTTSNASGTLLAATLKVGNATYGPTMGATGTSPNESLVLTGGGGTGTLTLTNAGGLRFSGSSDVMLQDRGNGLDFINAAISAWKDIRCGGIIASGQVLAAAGLNMGGTALINIGTANAKAGGSIFDHYTDTASVSTDGTEDDLYSDTIAASTLGADGDMIVEEELVDIITGASKTHRVRKYFAGTVIYDTGTVTGGGAASDYSIITTIIRESSTVVRVKVMVVSTSGTAPVALTYTRITGLTLSGTNILKTTGVAGGAGVAVGDIVSKMAKIEWKSAD